MPRRSSRRGCGAPSCGSGRRVTIPTLARVSTQLNAVDWGTARRAKARDRHRPAALGIDEQMEEHVPGRGRRTSPPRTDPPAAGATATSLQLRRGSISPPATAGRSEPPAVRAAPRPERRLARAPPGSAIDAASMAEWSFMSGTSCGGRSAPAASDPDRGWKDRAGRARPSSLPDGSSSSAARRAESPTGRAPARG